MGQIETGAEAHPKLAAGRESLPYPVDDLGDYGSTYLLGAMIGIRSLLSGYTSDCSTPSWPTIKRMRSFIALSTLSFLLKVCVPVEGHYIVEVRLNGYTNPSGKCRDCDWTLNCCDIPDEILPIDIATDDCIGERRCDSYFNYCLRPFGDKKLYCSPSERRGTSSRNSNDGPLNFYQSRVLGLSNPQILSGLRRAYEGVQVYVEILDEDDNTRNDLVDQLLIDHDQTVARPLRQNYTGMYNFVTMDLTITVLCAENFGGSDCTQCIPGFTGPDCNETDHCSGVSCGDNGVCRNVVNSQFQCTCSPGFTGVLCQTNIDRGGARDAGAIAGGVIGALLAVVVLLILVMITVVIILKHYNNRREVNKGNINSGPLPGDNPIYEQGNATSEIKGDSSLNTRTPATTLPEEGGTENGAEERNFDNFIYGDDIDDGAGGHVYTAPFDQQDQQSLHDDHEFDNPIYGTDTSDS